jgi:chemotaxis protein methyltransferase CheR
LSTRAVAVAYGEDFDDHLSAIDFGRIARLIVESEAGIKMPPGKRLMVEGRLRKRMRALGIPPLPTIAPCCSSRAGSTTS